MVVNKINVFICMQEWPLWSDLLWDMPKYLGNIAENFLINIFQSEIFKENTHSSFKQNKLSNLHFY